jgi:hypothetical protein
MKGVADIGLIDMMDAMDAMDANGALYENGRVFVPPSLGAKCTVIKAIHRSRRMNAPASGCMIRN